MGRQRFEGDGYWQEHYEDEGMLQTDLPAFAGFSHLIDADQMCCVQFCHGAVNLPGSNQSRVLAAISADAAVVRNTGKRKLTTIQLRWLGFGWRGGEHVTYWHDKHGVLDPQKFTTDADRANRHQLHAVHSAAHAPNLGVAFSGDGNAFSSTFVAPYLRQSSAHEAAGGMRLSHVSHLPPLMIHKWPTGGPERQIPEMKKIGMIFQRTGKNTKTFLDVCRLSCGSNLALSSRARLVLDSLYQVQHILTGDGAFLNNSDQVSISSQLNDPDSNASKTMQNQGFEVCKIEEGEIPQQVLQDRDPNSYFIEQVQFCNPRSSVENLKMQAKTREPDWVYGAAVDKGKDEQLPPTIDADSEEDGVDGEAGAAGATTAAQTATSSGSKRKATAASLMRRSRAPAQRKSNPKATKPPAKAKKSQAQRDAESTKDVSAPENVHEYVDPDLRDVYDHETWHPRLPADLSVAVTTTTFIRVPVRPPEFGERNLPGLWGDGSKSRRRKGKCIMHGAMRTGVNNVTKMINLIVKVRHIPPPAPPSHENRAHPHSPIPPCALHHSYPGSHPPHLSTPPYSPLPQDFEEGKGNNQEIIEESFNKPLEKFGIACKLNVEAKPPKCYQQSLNGSQTTKTYKDAALLENQVCRGANICTHSGQVGWLSAAAHATTPSAPTPSPWGSHSPNEYS